MRPSWHEYFLSIAKLTSERSNCCKRKVGAVVVKKNRILGLGYNGTPAGTLNCFEGGCTRCIVTSTAGHNLDVCMCLHAEENALLFISQEDLRDSILYVTLCPCIACVKKILQCRISEVHQIESQSESDALSKMVLEKYNVPLIQHPDSKGAVV